MRPGERVGHLTVKSLHHRNKHGIIFWECVCDCGAVLFKPSSSLKLKRSHHGCPFNLKTCTFEDCTKTVEAKGLCSTHYHQQRRGKELTVIGSTVKRPRKDKSKRVCDFEGCGRPHTALGLCAGHRMQQKRGAELTPLGSTRSKRATRKPKKMREQIPSDPLQRAHYLRDKPYKTRRAPRLTDEQKQAKRQAKANATTYIVTPNGTRLELVRHWTDASGQQWAATDGLNGSYEFKVSRKALAPGDPSETSRSSLLDHPPSFQMPR